jgi:hypothetical protein
MSEQDVKNWSSGDVMVGYDPIACEIRYTTISTNRLLYRIRLNDSFWQRLMNQLKSWFSKTERGL